MDNMEVTLSERGQIVIPRQVCDAMGIAPGTRLDLRVVGGQLIVTKRVSLNLDRWLGSAPDDGLTTDQALQELRGRPVPWTGSERDERFLGMPHSDSLAELVNAMPRPAEPGATPSRQSKSSVLRKAVHKAALTGSATRKSATTTR